MGIKIVFEINNKNHLIKMNNDTIKELKICIECNNEFTTNDNMNNYYDNICDYCLLKYVDDILCDYPII